jgi:threonine dehydrogenase-like Zn-dependent dehydrogenase
MTTASYRAVKVSKPGRMEMVQRELTPPPPGKVRIRVEACGVCHSDSGTVEGQFPNDWPPCREDTHSPFLPSKHHEKEILHEWQQFRQSRRAP